MINSILQIGGATLLALVSGQMLVLFFSHVQRFRAQLMTSRIAHEHLLLNLRAARTARKKAEGTGASWNGIRKFSVSKKQLETGDSCSFYLMPHDKKPLPSFKPGQYLTFELEIPGQKQKVIRCYSLSDSSRPDYYRVTIKRCPAAKEGTPAGLVSNYFHDSIEEGTILDVKAPSGHFFLDTTKEAPVVLISGGIGITPVLSMLNELVENGSKREIWWFHGVRSGREHSFKQHLVDVAAKYGNVRLHACYSGPDEGDKEDVDYQHKGRLSVDLFKEHLPSNNYDYYLCGPGAMMGALVKGLTEWGVPEERVHFEAFGPASVKKTPTPAAEATPTAVAFSITFGKSGKTLPWDARVGSLLEFANANAVVLASGCCAGQCGTCVTALRSGNVSYLQEPGSQPEKGTCLACVAVPQSDLVIDA